MKLLRIKFSSFAGGFGREAKYETVLPEKAGVLYRSLKRITQNYRSLAKEFN